MKYCSISEVSAKFNIPESTLRYYEKKGLLPLIERDEAGRRLFSENQMTLLEIIIYLKNTHMPVKGIQQYVNWVVEGDSTTERRLEMMKNHKQAVLAEISLMKVALKAIDVKITRYKNRMISMNNEMKDQLIKNGEEEV
ncbi:DNA-binding transcriptional MerR regulator [Paenibacillus endophyticus]|uniref:DNA-binding transcriptional MerR regulator n=1 Tax=Paenibacillus endophyticus TaxID=1294268 RepID=A0A7W5GCI7_9BACL|nr:MerR family transcriptional regulator [Paenibacillus endophyticus]MBB3154047.1 DNA-binding transcriptional MerR regulator [Paenibacillus endophyticus]